MRRLQAALLQVQTSLGLRGIGASDPNSDSAYERYCAAGITGLTLIDLIEVLASLKTANAIDDVPRALEGEIRSRHYPDHITELLIATAEELGWLKSPPAQSADGS